MSLPKGFKRLEYIQSSGTQYLDTLFKPNNNTRVTADFEITESTVDWACVFGAREESLSRCFALFTNSNQPFYCNIGGRTDTHTFTTISPLGRHVADANKNAITINGISAVLTARTFQNTATTIYLCANNEDGAASMFCKMRIYSCQIYDNGTIVRDFIPCQTTAGEIGLWDDVNSVFYGNAGTGTFTAGPEVQEAPPTPSGFTAVRLTYTIVQLNWAASDGATGYKLYKNGALLATLTETSYTDTVELFSSTVYAVTAYNDDGESEASTLIYHAVPENPILYLVTERTEADVTAGNEKGTYRASDLNRVGAAMNYVADRLKEQGYDPHISPKTDWNDDEWVTPETQAAYLCDLVELRKQFALYETTPEVPPRILATGINTNDGLTYEWANDIEKILEDIDLLLTNASRSWFYSGNLFSGEV